MNASHRLHLVGTALVLATVAGWWLSGASDGSTSTAAAILLISAIKVRFVIREFMEVRHAPNPWPWVFDGWLATVVTVLLAVIRTSGH